MLLLTELFRQLGLHKPPLKATVIGVFIANEENSTVGGVSTRRVHGYMQAVCGGWGQTPRWASVVCGVLQLSHFMRCCSIMVNVASLL